MEPPQLDRGNSWGWLELVGDGFISCGAVFVHKNGFARIVETPPACPINLILAPSAIIPSQILVATSDGVWAHLGSIGTHAFANPSTTRALMENLYKKHLKVASSGDEMAKLDQDPP